MAHNRIERQDLVYAVELTELPARILQSLQSVEATVVMRVFQLRKSVKLSTKNKKRGDNMTNTCMRTSFVCMVGF